MQISAADSTWHRVRGSGDAMHLVGDVGEALDEPHDVRRIIQVVLGFAWLAPDGAGKDLGLWAQGGTVHRRGDHLKHVLVGAVVTDAEDEVWQVASLLKRRQEPLRDEAFANTLQRKFIICV